MGDHLLQGLHAVADSTAQAKTLQYFEQLKYSPEGWKVCGEALVRGLYSDDNMKFFCFQVLEHYIRTRHSAAESLDQQSLRKILVTWLQNQALDASRDKNFIRNKAAQSFALAFVCDYPDKWQEFFPTVLQTLQYGPGAVDMYLRILKAIDEEVVDRDIVRTQQEAGRNTRIKDAMRIDCVSELVDSWYKILKTYEVTDPALTCMCLDVIGAYVSWINISLIANDKFMRILLNHLSIDVLRESACDCFHEIISKGMDPVAKTDLVESLMTALESAGVMPPTEEEDYDFQAKLARLTNCAGSQLISSFNKLTKAGETAQATRTLQATEKKIPFLFRFLGSDDDDISQSVTAFAHTYIGVLKQLPAISPEQRSTLEALLYVVINKMKYDDAYNFDQESEDEVMFLEYRKELKVLFDNVAQLDSQLVLVAVHNVLNTTLGGLSQAKFMDVEIAVRLVYMLGEAIPGQQLYSDTSKFTVLQQMLSALVSSRISYFGHSAVSQMFFETVVRYDRFFSTQTQHIPTVVIAFLDDRGLRHQNCKVRSRCCYLLSRFIKSHKGNMQNYVDDVLKRLQTSLVITQDNGYQNPLSCDDQLFLYESAGILIVSSGALPEKQLLYMKNLLSPVIVKFDSALRKLMSGGMDEQSSSACAQFLYHLVAYASRASKAFPSHQALKQSGCAACFAELIRFIFALYMKALPIFLRALTVPVHRDVIHSGVRQYLHRMVICMGQDVLPFIPVAVTHLLEDCTARDIQEFIPLINQIIARFKQQIVPFLKQVFMAIVNRIFNVLSQPAHELDVQAAKERETLRRSYFLFIASIATNEILDVITGQEPQNVEQVLLTVIQGATEYPDPVAQRICFSILRKLVEVWGGNNGESGFKDFIYDSIVPACFLVPTKSTFDLNDAQAFLALQEIALTQKVILQKQGNDYVNHLQNKYLPTLNLSPPLIQEFTQALQHADAKTFKNYIKSFYTRLRS